MKRHPRGCLFSFENKQEKFWSSFYKSLSGIVRGETPYVLKQKSNKGHGNERIRDPDFSYNLFFRSPRGFLFLKEKKQKNFTCLINFVYGFTLHKPLNITLKNIHQPRPCLKTRPGNVRRNNSFLTRGKGIICHGRLS